MSKDKKLVTLTHWEAYSVPMDLRRDTVFIIAGPHVVGRDADTGDALVMQISHIDHAERLIESADLRYHYIGEPGLDAEGMEAWREYCAEHKIDQSTVRSLTRDLLEPPDPEAERARAQAAAEVLGPFIHPALPVDLQPALTLTQWQVMRCIDADSELYGDHLVGYCHEEQEGRVSSKLDHYDKENMVCVTRSGRVYQLIGPPGQSSDCDCMWGIWKRYNGVDAVNVSHEYHNPQATYKDLESYGRARRAAAARTRQDIEDQPRDVFDGF